MSRECLWTLETRLRQIVYRAVWTSKSGSSKKVLLNFFENNKLKSCMSGRHSEDIWRRGFDEKTYGSGCTIGPGKSWWIAQKIQITTKSMFGITRRKEKSLHFIKQKHNFHRKTRPKGRNHTLSPVGLRLGEVADWWFLNDFCVTIYVSPVFLSTNQNLKHWHPLQMLASLKKRVSDFPAKCVIYKIVL